MRIIKRSAKLPERNMICNYCMSEFIYDNKDIQFTSGYLFDERYVICPVCGKRICLERIGKKY